ncbi:MAG: glycosyl hydrolase family 18 protein [Dehalococcoidia bacterium]
MANLLPDVVGRSPVSFLVGVGAAVLALLLWILFLPPFSLVRGGGDRQTAGDGYSVKVENKVPAPPVGLGPATKYYDIFLRKSASGEVSISLPLVDPKGSTRGLSFYTYQGGKWQLVVPANATPDGVSAQGQIQSLPNNLVVFRRLSNAPQVMGALPSGKSLNQDAARQITILNPSGFSPSADGSVTGESPPAIPGAQYDVVPAVQAPKGGPGAAAVGQILAAQDKQAAHVAALSALAKRPGNAGIELEYTAVDPQQRQAFVDFAAALAQELHKNRQLLTLELPAPTLSGNGWNTGAYDWAALAKSADYVKLLLDADESVYRKQMPDLLKYLTGTAGVDPHKLILVTSAYSVEKSDQGVASLTRLSALSIASQIQVQNGEQAVAGGNVTFAAANLNRDAGASGLIWDSTTATVSFVYKVGDATHVVWIANEYSEGFKLDYVRLYRLGGVAVDDASADAALGNPWPAIAQYNATGAPPLLQPNGQLLAPSWAVDGKPLDTGGRAVVTWPAPPQPGDHAVSLVVSDGLIRVIATASFTLRAGATAGSTPAPGAIVAVSATPRAGAPTAAAPIRPAVTASAPTATR